MECESGLHNESGPAAAVAPLRCCRLRRACAAHPALHPPRGGRSAALPAARSLTVGRSLPPRPPPPQARNQGLQEYGTAVLDPATKTYEQLLDECGIHDCKVGPGWADAWRMGRLAAGSMIGWWVAAAGRLRQARGCKAGLAGSAAGALAQRRACVLPAPGSHLRAWHPAGPAPRRTPSAALRPPPPGHNCWCSADMATRTSLGFASTCEGGGAVRCVARGRGPSGPAADAPAGAHSDRLHVHPPSPALRRSHANRTLFSTKMPSGRWYPSVVTLGDGKVGARGAVTGKRWGLLAALPLITCPSVAAAAAPRGVSTLPPAAAQVLVVGGVKDSGKAGYAHEGKRDVDNPSYVVLDPAAK